MSEYRAVIADDEEPLRLHLKQMLSCLWPELEIAGLAKNGEEAIEKIEHHQPDIVFLDIKMPVYDGLQVATKVGGLCHIVFVTAYDDYAIEAFENDAVDYVLKPINEERLTKTIERLKKRVTDKKPTTHELETIIAKISQAHQRNEPENYLRWIKASKQEDTLLISVDEIYYFMAGDKYTTVITRDHEYLIKKSIKELETELDPDLFWRVHRSTLVNASYIEVAQKMINGRYTLQLKDSDYSLTVSRNYSHRFKQM